MVFAMAAEELRLAASELGRITSAIDVESILVARSRMLRESKTVLRHSVKDIRFSNLSYFLVPSDDAVISRGGH
jgi:hypothetical protein